MMDNLGDHVLNLSFQIHKKKFSRKVQVDIYY